MARVLVESGLHFWNHLEWGVAVGPEDEDGWLIYSEHAEDWNRAEEVVVQWLADNWRLRRWFRLWREVHKWEDPATPEVLHLGEM